MLQRLTLDYHMSFKSVVWVYTVLMSAFFTLIPLFATQNKTLFYLDSVLVGVLFVWTVKISLTSENKFVREPTLFLGVAGLLRSIAHFYHIHASRLLCGYKCYKLLRLPNTRISFYAITLKNTIGGKKQLPNKNNLT